MLEAKVDCPICGEEITIEVDKNDSHSNGFTESRIVYCESDEGNTKRCDNRFVVDLVLKAHVKNASPIADE